MKAEDVAEYLYNNPSFFETYSQMLADVVIPHPYGGRTISLSERQMITLRERVKDLEKKLHDLIEFGKENDGLQNKLLQFTLALFGARDLSTLQNTSLQNLREIFSVPHAALHLWKEHAPSAEVLAFADQHAQPVCLHQAAADTAAWFGEAEAHLRSFAYLPLRADGQTIGMLILASEDTKRFYPEMGTMFLQRIADLMSAAARPHL